MPSGTKLAWDEMYKIQPAKARFIKKARDYSAERVLKHLTMMGDADEEFWAMWHCYNVDGLWKSEIKQLMFDMNFPMSDALIERVAQVRRQLPK